MLAGQAVGATSPALPRVEAPARVAGRVRAAIRSAAPALALVGALLLVVLWLASVAAIVWMLLGWWGDVERLAAPVAWTPWPP